MACIESKSLLLETNTEYFDKMFKEIDYAKGKKDYGLLRYSQIVPKFGYGVPDNKSISELVAFISEENIGHILSIGAGIGFVEFLINSLLGKIVTATDPILSHGLQKNIENKWIEIEKINHKESLKKYGNITNCILLNWPSMDIWFSETIHEAVRLRIKYIIYIGETGCCPCTGDEETLQYIDEHYETKREIFYKTFSNIYDYITIYKIKN